MKKLLLALLFVSTAAFAQTETQQQTVECFPLNDIPKMLNNWKEEPVFFMDLLAYGADGEIEQRGTLFTINPKTRRWTLITQVSPDTVCIQGAGENFNFVNKENGPAV